MRKIILLFSIISLVLISCSDYLDINTDPNAPATENITSDIIFPGVEMNLTASYGDFFRIIGGYYSQHYAHSFGTSNYLDYSRFIMSATRSSSTYTQLYTRVLNNIETVRELSEAEEDWGTYLAATTLRVFTYQILVDAYGEVPFTESLDINNLSPKYDDGADIYTAIIAELDDALANVSSTSTVCTNFLFGTTTAKEWVSFAKALKLKLLMRISNTQDVSSELAALISEDDFPTSDVSYDDCWSDESGQASPFYQEEYATYFGSTQINIIANIAYMSTMVGSADTRYKAFFEPSVLDSSYTGGVSGTNFSTSKEFTSDYFCRPVFSYDMPVYLITVSEIEFFKAEYYARYGSSANAASAYQAAIEASFVSAGLSTSDAAPVLANYSWDNSNYAKLIGIQKWIALGGTNNFEAWCELRRLKFPAFGTISGEDLYDETSGDYNPAIYAKGTLYTPIIVNSELGANMVLQRLKYAQSSSSRNSNTPDNKNGDVEVFWAE